MTTLFSHVVVYMFTDTALDIKSSFQPKILLFSYFSIKTYPIRPYYCTVHLGFSKILGKLPVKYMYLSILRVHCSNNVYAIFCGFILLISL